MDEITVKELKRVLDLVSEDFVVHVEGRPISVLEIRDRRHFTLERSGAERENFHLQGTKGTLNLIPDEATTGPLAEKDSSAS